MGVFADPLFLDGLQVTLIGMGTVFTFLTLLVFATALMSRLVQRAVSDGGFATASGASHAQESADGRAAGVPAEHVAAIALALQQHRQG